MYEFFDNLKNYKADDGVQKNYHNRTVATLVDLSRTREQLEISSIRYFKGTPQFVYVLFIVLMGLGLVFMGAPSLLFGVLYGAFMFVLSALFFLIRDIDDISLGEFHLRYGNLKQLFEMIGEKVPKK